MFLKWAKTYVFTLAHYDGVQLGQDFVQFAFALATITWLEHKGAISREEIQVAIFNLQSQNVDTLKALIVHAWRGHSLTLQRAALSRLPSMCVLKDLGHVSPLLRHTSPDSYNRSYAYPPDEWRKRCRPTCCGQFSHGAQTPGIREQLALLMAKSTRPEKN